MAFWLTSFAILFVIMTILWWIQDRHQNATHVDVAWALGLGALGAAIGFSLGEGDVTRRVVGSLLLLIWSQRLGFYLFRDRVLGAKSEDSRYADLRKEWGRSASWKFFIFFQAQGIFILLFGLPIWGALQNSDPFPQWSDFLAIIIWIVSVVGESVADRQLERFRSRPENRGKTCRAGLWRYSRHPNYFFEWCHWFTYVALAVGSPFFWLSWLGPVLMFVFLFRITGIPVTEARAIKTRGDDYRRYQKETSVFIPWFPKKVSS